MSPHSSAPSASAVILNHLHAFVLIGWLRLVGSLKLQVSFAKEPYQRDNILQKRPTNRSLLTHLRAFVPMGWLRLVGSLNL